MPIPLNEDIAGLLDEAARIFAEQGANRFRVQAYYRAADTLRGLARPEWAIALRVRFAMSCCTAS